MYKYTLNFAFIFVFSFIFSGCKKEKITYPSQIQNSEFVSISALEGKKLILDSAVIYFENQSNGAKLYYNHFDSIQTKSVLDPFNGAVIPFDSIVKNRTSWKFSANKVLQLNDTLSYKYQIFNNVYRAYGMENGSSRPIEIMHSDKNGLVVRVFESYVTLNNEDYRFYSLLHFKLKGDTLKSKVYPAEFKASFNGTLPLPTLPSNDLTGTQWVIYKVIKNLNTVNCSDTLSFKSRTYYTLNNGAIRNYNLQYITGTGMYSFTIYYCYTLGGNYSGQILSTFIQDGQINALTMKDLYTNEKIIVWMKKI